MPFVPFVCCNNSIKPYWLWQHYPVARPCPSILCSFLLLIIEPATASSIHLFKADFSHEKPICDGHFSKVITSPQCIRLLSYDNTEGLNGLFFSGTIVSGYNKYPLHPCVPAPGQWVVLSVSEENTENLKQLWSNPLHRKYFLNLFQGVTHARSTWISSLIIFCILPSAEQKRWWLQK